MEHTPGPWRIVGDEPHLYIWPTASAVLNRHNLIADVYTEADARLIAAAPDLLEALKEIIAYAVFEDSYGTIPKAEAAIAKATS